MPSNLPSLPIRAAALLAILALAACDAPPSEADRVRSLPAVPLEQSLSAFRQVCVGTAPSFAGAEARAAARPDAAAYIFTVADVGGRPACSMRARAPAGTDVFQSLNARYGPARASNTGIITQFITYPGRPLLFLGGVRGGAGEGTFQVGITR
ncbi:MAG: hypothetical protein AAFR47_11475 [Pseudomonadota bacterium]